MSDVFDIVIWSIIAYFLYWIGRGFAAASVHAETLDALYSLL